MNKVVLIGRLARDPELRYTANNNTAVCQFTVAVDRRYKSENQPQADFIPVIAWRSTGEFVNKYFTKGSRIAVVGSIQVRSWEDAEGKRHYATEVVADEVEFCESKRQDASQMGLVPPPAYGGERTGEKSGTASSTEPYSQASSPDGYYALDEDDDDVPF